jgi:hypothetical protein
VYNTCWNINTKSFENETISGTSTCRGAPSVSRLLFADDYCFLFFKAEENQAQVMKNILNTYEAASGQAISLSKSEIFYRRNVSDALKNNITNILAVQAVLGTGKYLGIVLSWFFGCQTLIKFEPF